MPNPPLSAIQTNQVTFATNIQALELLQDARTTAQRTEATLRLGDSIQQKQADQIWERVLQLNTQIDILSGKIMDNWVENAASLTTQLSALSTQLSTSLTQIQADQDTANQVVNVLGLLDQVLAIAVKFIA